MTEKQIKEVYNQIREAKYCIAFTGAGISTLSGIPDFRSGNYEIWKKYDQTKIFEITYFYKNPKYFYEFAKEAIIPMLEAKPSIIHNLLSLLEEKKYLKCIITQNIDLLHQQSGSKKVYELHGSPMTSTCLECEKKYKIEELKEKIIKESVPHCDKCGGLIKPDVIFYGEQLNIETLNKAIEEANKADLCLVLGSTLVVYPAAIIPEIVIKKKGKIIIVNRDKTHLDDYALYKFTDLEKFGKELFDEINNID
ncbi:MAG TPA: NAD-dependent protein deacylase [bacterium]|nr:NAD-dependent protein deacylase [bacterium]HOL48519.1 NAD-dependent protein deacylase [bacterium]HPQ19056.1 NAD-dependent protein deacylase [bacterium]